MLVIHPIKPFFDENSRILILGSFPSVKSREQMFFYGHAQNRFWRVLSRAFSLNEPKSIEEKKELLKNNNIALWDVIASCEIIGSADSTIKNVKANDLSIILNNARIEKIIVNGKTAERYFNKYIEPLINRSAICLPSTSPANATYSLDRLVEEWKNVILS